MSKTGRLQRTVVARREARRYRLARTPVKRTVLVAGDTSIDRFIVSTGGQSTAAGHRSGATLTYDVQGMGGTYLLYRMLNMMWACDRVGPEPLVASSSLAAAVEQAESHAAGSGRDAVKNFIAEHRRGLYMLTASVDQVPAETKGPRSTDKAWRIPIGGELGLTSPSEVSEGQTLHAWRSPALMDVRGLVVNDANWGFADDRAAMKALQEQTKMAAWCVLKTTDRGIEQRTDTCRGPAWALEQTRQSVIKNGGIPPHLVCVTSVDDIRRTGYTVSRSLSWERTAQDVVECLVDIKPENDPLGGCELVVVTFGTDGVLALERCRHRGVGAWLVCDPRHVEGAFLRRHPGHMRGYDSAIVVAIAHFLRLWSPLRPLTCADLVQPLRRGLACARMMQCLGFTQSPDLGGHVDVVGHHDGHAHPLALPIEGMSNVLASNSDPAASSGVGSVAHAYWKCFEDLRALDIHDKVLSCRGSSNLRGPHYEVNWWTFLDTRLDGRGTPPGAGRAAGADRDAPPTWLRETRGSRRWAALDLAWEIVRSGHKKPSRIDHLPGSTAPERPFPVTTFGKLVTADRRETEMLRTFREQLAEYGQTRSRSKPLNVLVLGMPGNGKTFTIRQVAENTDLPNEVAFLEKNLSGFTSPEMLYDSLHDLRDKGLSGKLPVVFWDEYDTALNGRPFGWLPFLIQPMWDATFPDGQVTHSIGKAVFVFAGSSYQSLSEVPAPASAGPWSHRTRGVGHTSKDEDWRANKGMDFLSRIANVIEVQGPNPGSAANRPNSLDYLIQRAILIRYCLAQDHKALFDDDRLLIDRAVARALLQVARYKHGARSIQTILATSTLDGKRTFEVSSLPPEHVLAVHVDVREFEEYYRSTA